MFQALIPIALGAGGGLMSGLAKQEQAKEDAKAMRRNAVFKERAATDAKRRGQIDADWKRVEGQQQIGTQRAAAAANGGIVGDGSNAVIEQDTAQLSEYDALVVANNAAREAYGYQVEAHDLRTTANRTVKNAKSGVLTSMLGGALSGGMAAYGAGAFG